jgi:hypothetical protein
LQDEWLANVILIPGSVGKLCLHMLLCVVQQWYTCLISVLRFSQKLLAQPAPEFFGIPMLYVGVMFLDQFTEEEDRCDCSKAICSEG